MSLSSRLSSQNPYSHFRHLATRSHSGEDTLRNSPADTESMPHSSAPSSLTGVDLDSLAGGYQPEFHSADHTSVISSAAGWTPPADGDTDEDQPVQALGETWRSGSITPPPSYRSDAGSPGPHWAAQPMRPNITFVDPNDPARLGTSAWIETDRAHLAPLTPLAPIVAPLALQPRPPLASFLDTVDSFTNGTSGGYGLQEVERRIEDLSRFAEALTGWPRYELDQQGADTQAQTPRSAEEPTPASREAVAADSADGSRITDDASAVESAQTFSAISGLYRRCVDMATRIGNTEYSTLPAWSGSDPAQQVDAESGLDKGTALLWTLAGITACAAAYCAFHRMGHRSSSYPSPRAPCLRNC